MKKTLLMITVLLVPIICRAEWVKRPDSEKYQSENKKYSFITVTGDKDKVVKCKGTLSADEKTIWSRFLVNHISPNKVYITNTGEYVVTIGESYTYGDYPLVIYDKKGKIVKSHSLKSLYSERDSLAFSCGLTWHNEYIMFFNQDENHFYIRKGKGIYVIVDLRTGDVFFKQKRYSSSGPENIPEPEWEKLVKNGNDQARQIAVEYLNSFEYDKKEIGCRICGEMKIRESIPKLKEYLSSQYSYFSKSENEPWMDVFPIRDAASDALNAMGVKHETPIVRVISSEQFGEKPKPLKEPSGKIPMITENPKQKARNKINGWRDIIFNQHKHKSTSASSEATPPEIVQEHQKP